jgi:uncharacterized protein (TIGR03437 family)
MKRGRWFLILSFFSIPGAAATAGRYALILNDPPVSEFSRSHRDAPLAAVEDHHRQIRSAQESLRSELERRQYTVTGSVRNVLNAVFVVATPDRVAELRGLQGVKAVRPLRRFHRNLDAAVKLVNANPAAWNLVGGVGSAGAGVKIAVIDTGIDQTHPAFQDNSLSIPAGFPKCGAPSDCAFTNHKVIVARSYVQLLAAGFPPNPAATSRPDDYSARDRSGHGTAVAMCAAGKTNTGPADTITGMAPKAYLGNYKVFGSPEVNDFTGGDVIISAVEDALNDGMNIAELSLGGPAFSGPLDQGAACGETGTTPCDPEAAAIENAVHAGMLVVVAAGNEGDTGNQTPTLNTVGSPGDAPSAIAVGASTNSHFWNSGVRVTGSGVPSAAQKIEGQLGDGPFLAGAVTAPLRDVGAISSDPFGCAALPAGSLNGKFALVERNNCKFLLKVTNAQNAGAVGVIFWDPAVDTTDAPSGLTSTNIPTILIGVTGGTALKTFIDAHENYPVTIDTALDDVPSTANDIASFSSRGPSIIGALKPDVTAVGTDMYMAAETFDPNGDLYSVTGYTAADGTSFSTPLVAGGAALVKQQHPNFTAAELKSAIVNTAVNTAAQGLSDENGTPASVLSAGAGMLDAAAAIATTVTVAPASLSFGILNGKTLPVSQQLQFTNRGSSTVNLILTPVARTQDANAHLTLSKAGLTLAAGESASVTVSLTGTMPKPGAYEGALNITGGVKLHVPYLYLVGDGVATNIIPLLGPGDDCSVGHDTAEGEVAFLLIDQFGVPVANTPVTFSVNFGGGQIKNPDKVTDSNGIAGAEAVCGPKPGGQEFGGQAAGQSVLFDVTSRLVPTISPKGAVGAAGAKPAPVAPGSYVSLYGSGLSDTTKTATTTSLPLAIDFVNVSFDVPSAGLSLPGRLYYVSPGLINLQVPWELHGQTSALIKVTIEDSQGPLYTLALADYAPAFFVYPESSTGKTLLAARDARSGKLISSANPDTAGEIVSLYANGLGPVNNQPATGEPAPSSPLSRTTLMPTVTIAGQPATVQFSGLTPGITGLYVVNVTLPSNIPAGLQPVVLTINSVASASASLPMK